MVFEENYTVAKMIKTSAEKWPEVPAQYRRLKNGDFEPITYRTMYQTGLDFGAGLMALGVKHAEPIGLISDNCPEWQQSDIGILAIGAVDVPRGCDATLIDLEQILAITECKISLAQNNAQVKKIMSLKEKLPALKIIIALEDDIKDEVRDACKKGNVELYTFSQIVNNGKKWRVEHKDEIEAQVEKGTGEDLATIIFTSGTTGTPKGVMLTHNNYISQLAVIKPYLPAHAGEWWLSVLPVWHVFERLIQYVAIYFGNGLAYSKPVPSMLLSDMAEIRPHWMCGVPRLWEALAAGVHKAMKKTGGIKYKLFSFFVNVGDKYNNCKNLVCGYVTQIKRRSRFFDFLIGIIPMILLWPI
ncbi:MAG: AMP-binding protein, partial [Treponema sp.]|nr:AMP-binding protein [Treponema sp.]